MIRCTAVLWMLASDTLQEAGSFREGLSYKHGFTYVPVDPFMMGAHREDIRLPARALTRPQS